MTVGHTSYSVSNSQVESRAPTGGQLDLGPVKRLLADHTAPNAVRSAVLDDLALEIHAGVFSPLLTKTSRFFASFVAPQAGDDVLDIFTGTGYLGLVAARRCRHVVCVDHSPAAAECARFNAKKNGVAEIVEVRCGDVFEVVKSDERFDLVITNPPLLPCLAVSTLETAVFDEGFGATFRFLDGLSGHLMPGGRGLVLLSDVFARCGHQMGVVCRERGLAAEPLGGFDAGYEVYIVFEMRHSAEG